MGTLLCRERSASCSAFLEERRSIPPNELVFLLLLSKVEELRTCQWTDKIKRKRVRIVTGKRSHAMLTRNACMT